MNDLQKRTLGLPPEQQVIRDKCCHPTAAFVEFPREDLETSVPARFEKIVRLLPERIAIEADRRLVTYSELNAMANRVAHRIVAERGTAPEPVALLIDKGIEQIAAMLGILKAGKFFVPIDPSYPLERMSSVVRDSQTALLIVDRRNFSTAQQITGFDCQLSSLEAMLNSNQTENLCVSVLPAAFACLLYTAGSTGKPKGVIRDHRGVLHGAMLRAHSDEVSSNDRLGHITAGTANAVTNSFYVLLHGATLVAFDVGQEGVIRLASWLVDAKITICLIASPLFRKLCAALTGNEKFPHLRYLRLRSDTVYQSDVDLFKRYFPPTCLLANGLASSETGPLREYRIGRDTEFPGPEVPVGYALDDKEILLVDDDGNEVATNEIGEIVVRSKYLAVGYWNNSQLTEAKFKRDPQDPEKRLFYTGDLGLMLPDGCLIHKGRKDSRIKVRGYGVDLLEVEKALRSYTGMKDIVVVLQNENNEARLVAYYTTHREPRPTVSELRQYLQNRLADYMIPSAFVNLKEIPVTPGGKVDRKALPEPENRRPDLEAPYVSPQDGIEQMLVHLWEEAFDLRPIGIDDNFFDLGGHSLLAAKLFAGIDEKFNRLLPLSVLLAAPTVRQLADYYRTSSQPRRMSALIPITRTGNLPPIYAVPGVFGNVVGLVDLSRWLGSHQPFYALQSIGLDGSTAPLDSIEEMASHYWKEIREFQPHGPYALLGACFGARVACEIARQMLEGEEEVAFLGLLDPIGLVRDKSGDKFLSMPAIVKRTNVLRSFVTDRLRLYLEEMHGLDNSDRVQFILNKIRSLRVKIGDRNAVGSVRREFHQLEVFKASKLAGKRYHRKPLNGCLGALEIFESSHPRTSAMREFNWNTLWEGDVLQHQVPGKDSGDMLSGKNAAVLAALLAERIRNAFESRVYRNSAAMPSRVSETSPAS